MNLQSKCAIVTGASRGSGAAFSKALVQKGTKVYGLARTEKALKDLQTQLGENFIPVAIDITNHQKVSEWMKSTFSAHNKPDILINNAGAGYFDKIDELPLEKWHQMMNANLNAVFYLTSGVVPWMKNSGRMSYIINIGSVLGKVSGAGKAAYSATKFGIQGYSEALFKELRGFDIKVSCLNPGSINTDFFEESGIQSNEKMLHPDELAAILIYLLETPDNVLIDELTVRPLRPK